MKIVKEIEILTWGRVLSCKNLKPLWFKKKNVNFATLVSLAFQFENSSFYIHLPLKML